MQDFYTKNIASNRWDRVGISVCKPYIYSEATDIIIGYIENKRAFIGSANIAMYYILGDAVDLGPALDIKVCYDARWRGNGTGQYDYFTIGEPYIVTIDTANRLYIRQGITGAKSLLATGVEKCSLVRGWKHISNVSKDQGLCVFYTRGGRIYSKAYVQQENGNYLWLTEEAYPQLGTTVKDVITQRTDDFRISISAVSVEGNKIAVTTRLFPGMSVPDETVMLQDISTSSTTLSAIALRTNYASETVNINASSLATTIYHDLRDTEILGSFNMGSMEIYLRMTVLPSLESISTDYYNIVIIDSLGYTFPVISIRIENFYLVLTVMDFSNAVGTLTIQYVSGMYVYAGISLTAFNTQFEPIDLEPIAIDPPIVMEITNVNTEVL